MGSFRHDIGWVQFPGISRVHYVQRSKALCGRYAYWGRLYDRMRYREEAKCRECVKKFEALEREKIYDPATEAWLAEIDWKTAAGGKED